jgi:hypothetical protein
MNTQPKAIRLADALDQEDCMMSAKDICEAAAELRRLHALLTASDDQVERAVQGCERLRVQRDALLEALKKLEYSSDGYIKRYPEESEVNAVIKAV